MLVVNSGIVLLVFILIGVGIIPLVGKLYGMYQDRQLRVRRLKAEAEEAEARAINEMLRGEFDAGTINPVLQTTRRKTTSLS